MLIILKKISDNDAQPSVTFHSGEGVVIVTQLATDSNKVCYVVAQPALEIHLEVIFKSKKRKVGIRARQTRTNPGCFLMFPYAEHKCCSESDRIVEIHF